MNHHTHAPIAGEASCCHSGKASASASPSAASTTASTAHGAHGAHSQGHGRAGWGAAASVTLHCLTGCAIGEWIGLSIGVGLGWAAMQTIALAIVLSFISGFTLTLVPLMRRGMTLGQAFRIIWIGEAVSIAVMEMAMNVVDYNMGGMQAGMSLLHPQYWIAFGIAALAGYLAAWPVNRWLLGRNLKNCH